MPSLRSVSSAIALAFVCCLSAILSAQSTIHVPADQPTIQAGINAAANGDTVLVEPGTYYENIDFKGKAITVTSSGGSAMTTIDGGNKAPTVSLIGKEPRSAVLSNFTITHGSYSNYGYGGAGGVVITNSLPTILNNIITQNYCQGISINSAAPLIQDNTISSSLTPEKCSVEATGGIYVGGGYTTDYINYQSAQIIGNTIESNTTGEQGDGGGDGGAGIAVWGGSPLIQANIIRNNITHSGSGGGIYIIFGGSLSIVDNLIYGNFAGCGGGGIAAWSTRSINVTNLLIANNTLADNTGGTTPSYTDCTKSAQLWDNFDESNPSIKFVNNIISGASSYPSFVCGIDGYPNFNQPSEGYQTLFDHNLLYNGGAAFLGGPCVDITNLHGNISVDPQFVNTSAHDYHLRNTSPAIDSGNGSVLQMIHDFSGVTLSKDLDGNDREQDATGKGLPVIDMGAYEFSGAADAAPTRVVLSSSGFSGPAGSNFVLTAALSSALGVPTGSANFFMDNQQIGSAAIHGGVATLSNVTFRPGVHVLYATYDGQGSFQPAISVIIVVDLDKYSTDLQLTSSVNPSLVGQTVTFALHVSSADLAYVPAPVQLTDTSTNTALATLTPDAAGNASYMTSALALGYHSIVASYAGDSSHASASASVFQQVITGYTTTTLLTSSLNPSRLGQSVTFTAHLTSSNGVPTGSVQFTDGATVLGAPTLDSAGNASVSTASLIAGAHNITATYMPTGAFGSSSGSLVQQVNGLATTSVLSVNPASIQAGDSASLTATVTSASGPGTPTGTVTFYDGATNLGTASLSAGGIATLSSSNFYTGGNTLTCTYSGDSTFSSSNCASAALEVKGADTTTTLVSSANPSPALTPVTFTATLTSRGQPNSSGNHFFLDGTLLQGGTPGSGGTTSVQLSLPAGSHTVTAEFAGVVGLNGSSATLIQTVNPNPTTTSLSSLTGSLYQNQPISLAAIIKALTGTAQPYGTVTLLEGATPLGSQTIASTQNNPVVSFSLQPLSPGTHILTAVYTPADGNFLGSTTQVPLTVQPQGFTFSMDQPSISIQAEHHASIPLHLASFGGFAGAINLACGSPLPPLLTCELGKGLHLAANSTTDVTLTLDTDAVLNFKSGLDRSSKPGPILPGIALAAGLPLALAGFRRRRFLVRTLLLVFAVFCGLSTLTGCGDKYPAHTPAGTYDITLTATGAPDGTTATSSQTLHLSMTVTP